MTTSKDTANQTAKYSNTEDVTKELRKYTDKTSGFNFMEEFARYTATQNTAKKIDQVVSLKVVRAEPYTHDGSDNKIIQSPAPTVAQIIEKVKAKEVLNDEEKFTIGKLLADKDILLIDKIVLGSYLNDKED